MLNAVIYTPLATGLIVLAIPRSREAWVRLIAVAGAVITLALSLMLWARFDPSRPGLQFQSIAPWIPAIGATYDVAVDGVSLPLIVLVALLLTVTMIYVLPQRDRARAHAFLFLLLATGLLGVFTARDLLLFYLFFEIGLVPMYFIIGMWGGPDRRYAAFKFFLYTRAGSLAMLLGFLGLYVSTTPHTFSLSAIIQAQPLARSPTASALVFFAMLLGFGVKLPTIPLHNWLPDAHVEAPTEGSIVLAGLQLKMGAYGLIAILLPTLPGTVQRFGWLVVALALGSLLYGALATLAQSDLKRLIAYTSVNHMGYVMLALAIAAMAVDPAIRSLALTGAVVQMVSHGLLTGGLFLTVGMLQHRAGTRELARYGGLIDKMPAFTALLVVLAFGSFGLPGLSGFIAELQVIGAAVSFDLWAAIIVVLALVIMTAAYLRIAGVVTGKPAPDRPPLVPASVRELGLTCTLAGISVLIGILPAALVAAISVTTRVLAQH